jgi:hypothetical protein
LFRTAAEGPVQLPRRGYAPPLNEKGCENQFGGFGPLNGFDFPLPVPR